MPSVNRIIGWFRQATVLTLFGLASFILFWSLWNDLLRLLLMVDAIVQLPFVIAIWFTMGFPLEMLSPPGWIVLLVWFIAYAVSYTDLTELLE